MPNDFKTYLHRVGRTARAGSAGKSVSLVGEADRKLLKMATKHSKQTVKHRKIPMDILTKYSKVITDLQPKVKEILAQEKEEKMVSVCV